ncbi:hypothetical protein PbB2_02867 [Candidatus Phycosocius bacilliformis]|uniref:Uncharacterized protein n=1 Tax=Candidatus Phycosocius bacilliformis TaxID=1445552 RepID=A0A2P2EDN5_9PROT|nr:hypothetical protein PbB2_02867 [Candidatus Phycosocius bacilliformis]
MATSGHDAGSLFRGEHGAGSATCEREGQALGFGVGVGGDGLQQVQTPQPAADGHRGWGKVKGPGLACDSSR